MGAPEVALRDPALLRCRGVFDPAHLRRLVALVCVAAILLAAAAPAGRGILFAIAVPVLILSAPESTGAIRPADDSPAPSTQALVPPLSGRAPPSA
jgi:hypothetical protein